MLPMIRAFHPLADSIGKLASGGLHGTGSKAPYRVEQMRSPHDEPLWLQAEAAAFLRVSPGYLRRSNCPKRLLPSNRPGGRPLLRYVPAEVRQWDVNRRSIRKVG
jgi:hypothetical protein